jgi:hypothetical protein
MGGVETPSSMGGGGAPPPTPGFGADQGEDSREAGTYTCSQFRST